MQGAADSFDHHDKKATALVALRNRALALQRRLRARPPSTPAPSALPLPTAGPGPAAAPAPLVGTDLAIEALDAAQEAAVLLYGAVIAHHYLPARPAGPPRRLRSEAMPVEGALHRLVALVDPAAAAAAAASTAAAAIPGANAVAERAAAATAGAAGTGAAGEASAAAVPLLLLRTSAAKARAEANQTVALELGALRVRMRRFRQEMAPFVLAALREGPPAASAGEGEKGGGKAVDVNAGGAWWDEGGPAPSPRSEGAEGENEEEEWEDEDEEEDDEDEDEEVGLKCLDGFVVSGWVV